MMLTNAKCQGIVHPCRTLPVEHLHDGSTEHSSTVCSACCQSSMLVLVAGPNLLMSQVLGK